ncbi:hypothetical protein LZC95_19705 [Pendulispora brunnea]|uniref:Uncharacterized protein n=1 Tax=Pendulispora brunnea TaxID=2905690 RepID=A0ABZ2KLV1_9BACT
MFIALNFFEALQHYEEAGLQAIELELAHTLAYREAIEAAEGKTAEIRKAKADEATAIQLAELRRAQLKERAHFQVVLHYRGQGAPEKPAFLQPDA